ncbi:MAG: uracil-DNA glycosylase, partial [Gelidibacter sp.]|nr:uracil-DNA glycosylase [Gelidibacter sp.]
MDVTIHQSWKPLLQAEFDTPYFENLQRFVKKEYTTHKCYPPGKQIFAAFDWCPFDNLKVVIIGQDPYHGIGQANGLCFSVNDSIAHPPSLINIFKEIESDLSIPYPKSGNLERWAKQGVLLLNATLTVRAHQAGSHQKRGWEIFTDAVIRTISDKKENVVFLLWGGFAKQKSKLIDTSKHKILATGHPSPLSANRGYWFGN